MPCFIKSKVGWVIIALINMSHYNSGSWLSGYIHDYLNNNAYHRGKLDFAQRLALDLFCQT